MLNVMLIYFAKLEILKDVLVLADVNLVFSKQIYVFILQIHIKYA